MLSAAGYNRLHRIRIAGIREKLLDIFNLNEGIDDYRIKWKGHIERMLSPDRVYAYTQKKRRLGRPNKKWKDREKGA